MADSRPELKAEEVAAYLSDHPDFFAEHSTLFSSLGLDDASDNAFSFALGKAVILKQQKNDQRISEIFRFAQQNDRLFELTRKLILAMLEANDLKTVLSLLKEKATSDFHVDSTIICLLGDGKLASSEIFRLDEGEAKRNINALIQTGRPVCGALRSSEAIAIFGSETAVQSAVVLPLEYAEISGFLAFGSTDPHFFTADQDTLFVGFIAEVLARLLAAFGQTP